MRSFATCAGSSRFLYEGRCWPLPFLSSLRDGDWALDSELLPWRHVVCKLSVSLSARLCAPYPHGFLWRGDSMIGYLIDMDGVIYRGPHLIAGADRFIATLRERDIPFLFLTNNSQR